MNRFRSEKDVDLLAKGGMLYYWNSELPEHAITGTGM
jgi:hypothetical protein